MIRHCKRIAARAKLNAAEWGLHKFRKTYCTNLLRSGIDLRTVMAQMGHSNLATTMRYLQPIDAEQLRGRIDGIWGQAPGQAPAPLPTSSAPAPLPPRPAETLNPPDLDLTDGVIFYEPEPLKHNGNGAGTLGDILSPTELEILYGLATGKTSADIARDMGITENAVKMRISRMLAKTGCRDRLQLAVRYARENLAELRAAAGVA